METKNQATDAFTLATRIAKSLAHPGWSARREKDFDGEDRKRFATIVRAEDGASVGVQLGGYRLDGRVTFRANWPTYANGERYVPREYSSVTCSAARGPTALARELERRLLATYEPLYVAALEQVRAANAASDEAWSVASRLAKVAGATVPTKDSDRVRRIGAYVELRDGPERVYALQVAPPYGDRPAETSFRVSGVDEATATKIRAWLVESEGTR